MDKKTAITELRRAKSAHIQWRSYAQALIAGIPVEKDHVPVIHTSCNFGKWYYGTGQGLSSLASYKGIEAPHEILHKIYINIFQLLFGDDNRSTMEKLFGSKTKLKEENQAKAEELMKKLVSVSATLLESIELLEAEIMSMSEDELASLV